MAPEGSANNWMRRGFLAAAAMLLMLGPSGCMAPELNERALVSMVGIDRRDDGLFRVTLGLIGTRKQANKDQERTSVFTVEGETLFDAARKFIRVTGNQPLWTYIKVIVIGPSAAEQDLAPIMDFFNRNNEIQPNPFIVYSTVPAEEALHLNTDSPELPALMVEKQIENQTLLSLAPEVTLYEWNEMMLSPERTAFASLMQPVADKDRTLPIIEGMAVFSKGKTVGRLGPKATRGVLWLRREVQGGIVVITVDRGANNQEVKLALEVTGKNKASIEPVLANGKLSVDIKVKAKLAVGEVVGQLNMDASEFKEIRQLAEEVIMGEIQSALATVQKEWSTDIFGIGRMVQRKQPGYWKEHKDTWSEEFASLPIQVTVSADITKFGLTHSYGGEGDEDDR